MQVAHSDDYDTHAVIGGKNVEEFGIAQTAEFFTVLSNTLYSNKPLAVIREVLCNAWDAQIVSGRQDRPVIVKIDEDKLSIRDFGPGIPHEMIHSIYCVYGTSTKENDGNQTGGFGLGSKSPFAYSDHFTVVNHYDGMKVVHAISRGSTLTKGKPDRRVMVQVPTTETGVEVIIPVKNREDMHLFIEIARDIAAFGEMNVMVNDKQVEVVPISEAENNLFLTTRRPRGSFDAINIRYGNVVYPVKPDVEYIGLFKRLTDILEDIPSRHRFGNDFVLILQAPANSISVTPSREALSNTETTIRTLKSLFTNIIEFMQTGNDQFEERLLGEQAKALDHMCNEGYADRVFFSPNLLSDPHGPKMVQVPDKDFTQITNMVGLADFYLRYKDKLSDKIKAKLTNQRVELMIDRQWRRKHDLKNYLRIMKKTQINSGKEEIMFRDVILRPMLKRLAKHPVLKFRSMYIASPNKHKQRYDFDDYHTYIPDNREFLKLLQGVVVVTHNKLAYQEDWDRLTGLKDTIPNDQPRMVYIAPRSKGHKEEAVAFFTSLGYHVVDFASIHDEDRAKNYVASHRKPLAAREAKPKNTGLVLLAQNISPSRYNFNMSRHLQPDMPRSDEYTHVLKPKNLSRGYGKMFFPWGDDKALEIARLFGSRIGVCVSEPQFMSQRKKGKGDGIMLIVEEVCNKVLTSTGIRTYVENKMGISHSYGNFSTILEMTHHSAVLKKAFNLPDTGSEDDLIYYNIFEIMRKNLPQYRFSPPRDGSADKVIYDTKEEVAKWTAAPSYELLSQRVRNSNGLNLLNLQQMYYSLRLMDKVNPNYQEKVFIETSVLNALNI